MASSSSSSSSVQQKYQVFPSFRGEDTRNNFVSHLHDALKRKGIGYFIDYQLIRGEEISQALLTAIEKSKVSIIVLSKNYASSSWCLDELSKILECKKTMGQKVVPIFYHVDPSDVRKQQGSFEEAFAKHQQRFKDETDKVERWRAALKEVGSLSGYHIQPHLHESTLVAEIVKDISMKLMYKSLCSTKRLAGIDSHIEKIKSLLCFDLAEVRIIGITGMGGIGKTTIAEVVYNLFCDDFDSSCFINVKEELNGGPGGQVRLREKLFSKILADKNLNLPTNFLPSSILDRLYCKKIFIVLDDVNHSTQLLDLLPEKQLFKPGSRIIVISRDRQVLKQVLDEMYEVEGMCDDKALQLFRMCAFQQSQPKEDFLELSKKVIHYTKGLPLALRVVGSALFGKSKRDWEAYLIKLKESSDLQIHEVLKISYDGLSDEAKGVFLDIACYFRWELKDDVENILYGCCDSVRHEISILVDKSLITVLHNMINMHDLVQLMAWNIIRQESKEPGKRSRLWTPEDICHVLKNNTGTESVEGMFLDMSKIGKLCLSPTVFEKMWNLRLLNFYYTDCKRKGKVYISHQDLECLPRNLISLRWDDYPSKSLPSGCYLENLVELRIPNSHVEQLWNGDSDLVKLKRLDLSGSQNLIKIPELSKATNLERMELAGCRSLVEVPSSIRYLNKLSYLDLSRCQNLGNFPSNVGLRSLTTLLLTDCSNITKFPEISMNLETLYLNGTAIEEVPSSIDRLSRLEDLNLADCRRLERLPSNICKLKIIRLDLTDCLKLESFPEILEKMECLEELCLSNTSIEELPSSIKHMVGLQSLQLEYCEKLKNLPSSIRELEFLSKLSLDNCSNFTEFPNIPVNLCDLTLSGTAIEQVPSSFECASELRYLYLENCTKLRRLPRNILMLKNLDGFAVSGFSKLEVIQELLGTVEELCINPSRKGAVLGWSHEEEKTLYLHEVPDNVENLKSCKTLIMNYCNLFTFPIRLTCISSLTCLYLGRNNFETIPASIKNLLVLKTLELSYCERLQSLPELPPNLQNLYACYCSSLETVSSLFTLGHGRRISYSFTDCLKLDHNAIRHIVAKIPLWIHEHRATADLKLDYDDDEGIVNYSSLTIYLPGSEIPEWFSCQNTGSSVTIQPPLYGDDRKFVGFVLCAVVAVPVMVFGLSVACKHNFKTNNGCHYAGSVSWCDYFVSVGSDTTVLGYKWVDDWMAYDGFSEVSFEFYFEDRGRPGLKYWLKKCGVHVLYRQNDQIISLPYNARVIQPISNGNLAAIQQLVPCQPNKSGSGTDSSDLPYAKDAEESNSIMIYQPSSSSDPTWLSLRCGVNNQDFGEPVVEDGTIIKGCRSDYCHDEAEPSGSFELGRDTILIQPSSPYDSTWLSLNCGVIDQGFGEPMQEDGTIIKRRRDDHHNNEAEPSTNFNSEQEEDEPRPKRLKRIIMTNRTLLFKSKVVRRRKKSPRINHPQSRHSQVSVVRRRTKSPWINQPTLISKSRVSNFAELSKDVNVRTQTAQFL